MRRFGAAARDELRGRAPTTRRGDRLSGTVSGEIGLGIMSAAANNRSSWGPKAPAPPREGVVRSTVRALLVPRRAIPIALVVVPLTIIQDAYSREAFAVPIALLMCGSFLLVGPSLWRALFPLDRPIAAGALTRVLVYAGVGAAVVLGVGRGLPGLAGAGPTFMTTEPSLAVCMALFWVGGWGLARDIESRAPPAPRARPGGGARSRGRSRAALRAEEPPRSALPLQHAERDCGVVPRGRRRRGARDPPALVDAPHDDDRHQHDDVAAGAGDRARRCALRAPRESVIRRSSPSIGASRIRSRTSRFRRWCSSRSSRTR